jgi:polyribonucleotide nucleotidyltransferase
VQVVRAPCCRSNPEVDADIAAHDRRVSAALAISGMPFNGPIGAARVGYSQRRVRAEPRRQTQMADCQLDLVVAGTEAAVLMVESEAEQLSEEVMLGAVVFGHEQRQDRHQRHPRAGATKPASPSADWKAPAKDEALHRQGGSLAKASCAAAYQIRSKQARTPSLPRGLRQRVTAAPEGRRASEFDARQGRRPAVRHRSARSCAASILAGEPRIDGRDTRTVRPIEIRNGVLPRTHGSALFTRGETQALVVATLGTDRRRADASTRWPATFEDRFLLHYNMPAVRRRRDRPRGHARSAARSATAAWPSAPGAGAADAGGVPLHHPRRVARSPSRTARSSMAIGLRRHAWR